LKNLNSFSHPQPQQQLNKPQTNPTPKTNPPQNPQKPKFQKNPQQQPNKNPQTKPKQITPVSINTNVTLQLNKNFYKFYQK
jgi:hypothetical protein